VAGSSPWQGKGLAAAQGRGKEEDLADTMFEELISCVFLNHAEGG
jgi:hypothetical protein